ncbi:hypothetical protein ACCO44_08110 [Microbacterium maritypicum]|uniref:hypothetical protein n=1 Tax=Microbacterium maritypicum TaxID=33918 RepID=UPI0035584ED5
MVTVATDFWGVVVPNWIAAAGGFIGTALAVVSLIVAYRASGTAKRAVANDVELREAVAIVAKPTDSAWGHAHATLTPEAPETPDDEGAATTLPFRDPEDQATLNRILNEWYPPNSNKSKAARRKDRGRGRTLPDD